MIILICMIFNEAMLEKFHYQR